MTEAALTVCPIGRLLARGRAVSDARGQGALSGHDEIQSRPADGARAANSAPDCRAPVVWDDFRNWLVRRA